MSDNHIFRRQYIEWQNETRGFFDSERLIRRRELRRE